MLVRVVAFALSASLCWPKVDITKVAAATTIAVNVLEIKTTIRKARAAAHKTKGVAVKVVKKIGGK